MGRIEKNKAIDLYDKAKNGSTIEKNTIIELCHPLIKNKAANAYNLIVESIKKYYNITDDNYILPNNILDLDDIIQDLSSKALNLLNLYLAREHHKKYFSTYLSHMLSSNIRKYANIKIKEIINTYSNEFNQNINWQYNSYQYNDEENIGHEIITNISNDKKLSKHIPFINAVFDCNSDDEIAKTTGVEQQKIRPKIEIFSEHYKNYLSKVEYKTLNYYIKSGQIIEDIKKGKLFEMPYFSKDIILALHDTYIILSKKYNISFKLIKEEFCKLLSDYLKNNLDNLYASKDMERYIANVLNEIKNNYLEYKDSQLKYVISKEWNKYYLNGKIINKEEVFNIAQNGKIYAISPYKEYIDIYIQKIYKTINQQEYIEIYRVNTDTLKMIKNYIEKSSMMIKLDLPRFNKKFINHLNKKGKMYIETKLSKNNKTLKIKKY